MIAPTPGTTWSHPIWHRKWRIYASDAPFNSDAWYFVHDDFDDEHDSRHGYAPTVDAAKEMIDDIDNWQPGDA